MALDQAGNLYVADRLNFRIQVFNSDGQYVKEWPIKGWTKDQIDMEPHLALDKVNSVLYVSDGRGKKVYAYHLGRDLGYQPWRTTRKTARCSRSPLGWRLIRTATFMLWTLQWPGF